MAEARRWSTISSFVLLALLALFYAGFMVVAAFAPGLLAGPVVAGGTEEGARRRPDLGGRLPRADGADLRHGLRRSRLRGRLHDGLPADRVLPGRQAAPARQVHILGRARLPARPTPGADAGGLLLALDRRLLPDRPARRSGPTDPAAVRPALPLCGGDRRRADDLLRDVRRHGRHHLGADHQGGDPARRGDRHGAARARRLRLQLREADRQGRRGGGLQQLRRAAPWRGGARCSGGRRACPIC